MSIVSQALVFATEHHKNQHRKGTKIPYMAHLLNVCKLLAERDCSDEILAAALLHDVVEGTDVTIEEVKERFGKTIAEIVRGATELDKLEKKAVEKESSWQTRKDHTIHFLQYEAPTDQLLVSCADKLDNLRSIVYDHARIGEALWNRFNASKDQQAWYYSSLARIAIEKGESNDILTMFGKKWLSFANKFFDGLKIKSKRDLLTPCLVPVYSLFLFMSPLIVLIFCSSVRSKASFRKGLSGEKPMCCSLIWMMHFYY